MNKFFKIVLIVVLVASLLIALSTCNKQQEADESLDGLIDSKTMYYSEDIETVYSATYLNGEMTSKTFEVVIPVYTDQFLANKVLYKSNYVIQDLRQVLFYSLDNGENYVEIGEVVANNLANYGNEFSYSLPTEVSRYTYFEQNNTLCRIDWGKKLQLLIQYTHSLYLQTNSNYNKEGSYSYTRKFDNGFNASLSASCFFMNASANNTPTTSYLAYLKDNTWINVATWQDLKLFYGDYIKFDVKLNYYKNQNNYNNGDSGAIGGGGGGSW